MNEQNAVDTAPEAVGGEEIRKALEKVDKESAHRELHGWQAAVIAVIAVTFSGFHIYTALFGVLDSHLQRAVHLGFVLTLVYLLYPASKRMRRDRVNPVDLLFVAASLVCLGYLVVNYRSIVTQAGRLTLIDVWVGTVGIVLLFEAARRIVGLPMVIIAALFVLYALIGEPLPGVFAHKNILIRQLVNHLWFTIEGVFGIPLGVSATFVFMFLLFAAFIEITGVGKLFIDLGNWLAGWASGGPAKVAVITSAFEGMVEGSSVSNVVGSGSFTIPMMKKLGYRPEFAGAVEAAASTGGQLMPPIMGAAAFLMAEFLNVPYTTIAAAAAIPAVLYFFGIFAGVHFEAKKLGLRGMPRSELPKFLYILRTEGINFIPLIAIIVLLTSSGFSLLRIALLSTASAILAPLVLFLVRLAAIIAGGKPPEWASVRPTRVATAGRFVFDSMKAGVVQFFGALIKGARSALGVATACALAGVIVGVVTRTGLGLKLASALVDIANGRLLLTMFFTMITSLILGMGVPTTANYIITSTIAAPALLMLGVAALPAHLFVFYFGIIADLTPPVALAAYAGAAIARANPFKTGVIATRLAVGAFILPYIFVANPQLLLIGATPLGIVLPALTAAVGMTAIGAGLAGFLVTRLHWIERLLLVAAGLLLVDPGLWTDIIGIVVLGGIAAFQVLRRRATQTKGA
ncbi:MAG: TRAP transporter permease [Spirochaetes bacterium]|nr:TRAP transporter permease [Spirochaetota bacterium]